MHSEKEGVGDDSSEFAVGSSGQWNSANAKAWSCCEICVAGGEGHDILSYYLPNLINRMTEEMREERSIHSSMKRLKTVKLKK
ncbi:unnamed protein product [Sphagnum balticum]